MARNTRNRSTFLLAAAVVAAAGVGVSTVHASVIADWTFESLASGYSETATTSTPYAADTNNSVGTATVTGVHVSSSTKYNNVTGNGSSSALNSSHWAVNDYYEFDVSSGADTALSLSIDAASSNTGPSSFSVYAATTSTSGAYTQLLGTYSVGASYATTVLSLGTVAGVTGIRLIDASATSANGGTVGSTGTSHIDNVIFSGTVPGAAPAATLDITNSDTAFDLLKGASVASGLGTVTVNNTGNADGNYSDSSTGTSTLSLSSAGGVSPQGGSTAFTYTPTTAIIGAYGVYATQVTVTPSGTSDDTPLTTNVTYYIGQVSASNANSISTFGAFTDTALVASGDSFVGLSSKVTVPGTPSGTGAGQLGSEAIILDGTNTTGADMTVGEDWRARTTTEAGGAGSTGSTYVLASDVLKLTGIPGGDLYTLQISYDPALLDNGAFIVEFDSSTDTWVPVEDSTSLTNLGDGAYTSADFIDGYEGYDASTDTAFVVLDHSGTFAVVPEPASLGLLMVGLVPLLGRRQQRAV